MLRGLKALEDAVERVGMERHCQPVFEDDQEQAVERVEDRADDKRSLRAFAGEKAVQHVKRGDQDVERNHRAFAQPKCA